MANSRWQSQEFDLGDDSIEFRGDPKITPSVLRVLVGKTAMDIDVDNMKTPKSPTWLRFAIGWLRAYRSHVSNRLGRRCVFEPSCSRYAELALRKHGLAVGLAKTLSRLFRCRPGQGGLDLP